jgi:hypothetical protein
VDVIDLNAEREKRDGPDPEFIRRDDFGRPMYLFGLDYAFHGKEWMIELWAYSFEDAEARVEAMRSSLRVMAQKYAEVPVGP